jgi:pimeloyl-ACP methyl ester carboxylesterase
MPYLHHGSSRIRYELERADQGPAYVLVNGLAQHAELWGGYRDALAGKGFRVATFDLLGQRGSDKPTLFIDQDDQVDLLGRFAEDVLAKRWQGARSVWIAPNEAGAPLVPFPADYDHLRAIPARRVVA